MFTDDELLTHQVVLNMREVATTLGISERLLQTMELERVQDEITHQLLYRLRAVVYTQSLAPDVVPVSLRTSVPVVDREHECWQVPRGWLDYLALRYPRLRRFLGGPRFVVVDYVSRGSGRLEEVVIERDVVIEREFAYPDASVALPPDRFGRPILFEFVRTPEA